MLPKAELPIIILAAGQSRRMRGRDKLLERVDGVPLIRRQAELASAAAEGPVLVALPVPPHPRYEALEGCTVQKVPIAKAQDGISESLKGALDALPPDAPAAMLLLADLPDLTVEDLLTVFEAVDLASDQAIWRGTTEDGKPGHPIVVRKELFGGLKATTGDTGVGAVMQANRNRSCFVPLPKNRALCDLDTPEDWAAWRAARGAVSHD